MAFHNDERFNQTSLLNDPSLLPIHPKSILHTRLLMVEFASVFRGSDRAPSCHAATVVESAPGVLLAAWFAGIHEGHPSVAIWCARCIHGEWQPAQVVADIANVPLWNPVLFCDAGGVIWLFYKAGPDVPSWSGLHRRSHDGGMTWTPPALLPAGILGPIKNKPIALSNGDILSGVSVETWRNWVSWAEVSSDGGESWTRHGPILPPGFGGNAAPGSGAESIVSATWDAERGELLLPQQFAGVIQPTVWESAPGHVRMLLRATQQIGAVCVADSHDSGRTWTPARPTTIPNSNSGLDAVRLSDGRIALVCNPVLTGRTPLALLLSSDNGESWQQRIDLETEPGEYSYPSIIQAADGRLHVVYTWRREAIRHAVIEC